MEAPIAPRIQIRRDEDGNIEIGYGIWSEPMLEDCWKRLYYHGEGSETMPDMRHPLIKVWMLYIATIASIPCAIMMAISEYQRKRRRP